ncbi:MAG: hypothetical protein EXS31_01680 [Pedosphaera sp.]|nr:hypothetical protein [Pedosphaera sp.]
MKYPFRHTILGTLLTPIYALLVFGLVALADDVALAGNRHRVLVSSDIGGTDPDDDQSMVHLLVYGKRGKQEDRFPFSNSSSSSSHQHEQRHSTPGPRSRDGQLDPEDRPYSIEGPASSCFSVVGPAIIYQQLSGKAADTVNGG